MSQHRTVRRRRLPGTPLWIGALIGALVGGALAALVVAGSPAQAGLLTIPVACSTGKVVLDVDDADYELHGTCGVVEAKPIDVLAIKGHGNQVALPSARMQRLTSPGSVVSAEGLLEDVALGRGRGTVPATATLSR